MKGFFALFRFGLRRQRIVDLVFVGVLVGLLAADLKEFALMGLCGLHSIVTGALQGHWGCPNWDATLMTMPVSPGAVISSRYSVILFWTVLRTLLCCGLAAALGAALTAGEVFLLLYSGVALGWLFYTGDPQDTPRFMRGQKFWGVFAMVLHFQIFVPALMKGMLWVAGVLLVFYSVRLVRSWVTENMVMAAKDW